jgi:glycosyl transferase family 25
VAAAQARRAAFVATVPDSAIEWEFFDACTGVGQGLAYNDKRVRMLNNRPLQNGELGCYSSHFHLWNWLERSTDYDQMVVIEDDVVMDWGFLAEMSRGDFQSQGIEYLRLFAKMPSPWRFVASPFLDRYRHLIQFTGYPLGTQAYLVTRDGAKKFRRNGQVIEAAVDVYMDRTWEHEVLNLAIFPFPAYERHQSSSIGEGRFESAARQPQDLMRSFLPKLRRRLHSLWQRYGLGNAEVRRLRRRLKGTSR